MKGQIEMLTAKSSKMKIFLSFMIVFAFAFIWGFYLFNNYVDEFSTSAQIQVNFFDIDVWPMVLVGSLPLPLAILIPIYFLVPRIIEIKDDALLYKIGFSKTSKKVCWKEVSNYKKTFLGFNLTLKDKNLQMILTWFKKGDKEKVFESIAQKINFLYRDRE